jgi:tetratricopeptide (TPR) repeat protein
MQQSIFRKAIFRRVLTGIFALFLLYATPAISQQSFIDSLEKVLLSAKADTQRLRILNVLSSKYLRKGEIDKSFSYAQNALKLSEKTSSVKGIVNVYNNLANLYKDLSKTDSSLYFFRLAIEKSTANNYKEGLSMSHQNLGILHISLGNNDESLKNFRTALRLKEELGDVKGVINCRMNIGVNMKQRANYPEALKEFYVALGASEKDGQKSNMGLANLNIGIVYAEMTRYDEALKHYFAAQPIFEQLNDMQRLGTLQICIGVIHTNKQEYDKALVAQKSALKIYEKINYPQGMASAHGNMGNIYQYTGKLDSALKEYLLAYKIFEEIGAKSQFSVSLNNIGRLYLKMKNPGKARETILAALRAGKGTDDKNEIWTSYLTLSQTDSALAFSGTLSFREREKYWLSSLENFKLAVIYKDSLLNEENNKKIVQQQMQYDFDRKEALANAEQAKKDLKTNEEKSRQTLLSVVLSCCLATALIAGLFIFRSLKINQRKKKIITAQKVEVERQMLLVEQKQKEILDSIYYARRIQWALISSELSISKMLTRLNR